MEKEKENQKTIIKEFLLMSDATENEINILNNVKEIYFAYCKEIIQIYLDINDNNKINITKKQLRYINFIIKKFINNIVINNNNKYIISSNSKDSQNIKFILLIIFIYYIYKEEIQIKSGNYFDRDLLLRKLYELLCIILKIICKIYLDKLIDDKKLEITLKLFIILSISSNCNEKPKKNDKIENMMFFSESIHILKDIYNKIFSIQNNFTTEQENVMNNIFLFIKDNIIGYSNYKPINIINKSYLSHNEFYTSSIIELIFVVAKMKNPEIINNFIDLLTNIYAFSFRYDNMMNPLLKILEPLLMNIKMKNFEDIKYDLNISIFPIKFLKALIEKEQTIKQNDSNF